MLSIFWWFLNANNFIYYKGMRFPHAVLLNSYLETIITLIFYLYLNVSADKTPKVGIFIGQK